MARTSFGANLTGCSGTAHMVCATRSTADRIRRVVRLYLSAGGWSGWRTLHDLAKMAAERRGQRAGDIIREFAARREA